VSWDRGLRHGEKRLYRNKHLANANKFDHIRLVNASLGLFIPALVTPLELMTQEGLP
jgi:hypothetical protein